ncbi:alpha/beta hydrolase fold domain-containing protein [Arthrobacter sp. NPDC056691]|uniref:alpha/beta hydrolase fold domain-containing protein n=1 Tax=Arthrobacter sp. NPDC056691 TaxID=3345913 RepID=UPI0036708F26
MTSESLAAADSTVTADGFASKTAAMLPRRVPTPPPFPAFQTPGTPEEVSEHSLLHRELNYAIAVGFRRLSMDVWLPRNTRDARVPLVVWIHGGAFQLGDRRELPPTFQPNSVFRLLNEAGIACATVDYRHALEAPFPAQLHDIKAAVRYLREHAEVLGIDPERIGAWGESAGGHLAALLGLTGSREDLEGGLGVQGQPSSVTAVVDFYGVSSLTRMPPMEATTSFMSGALLAAVPDGVSLEPGPMLVGNSHDPALLDAASPLGYVTPDAPPFLLIHGDSDGLVPLSQSELLAEALAGAGAQQELITVEGGDHCFFFAEDQLDRILSTAVSFFAQELTTP